jgi:hypothetical protein
MILVIMSRKEQQLKAIQDFALKVCNISLEKNPEWDWDATSSIPM